MYFEKLKNKTDKNKLFIKYNKNGTMYMRYFLL